MTFIRKILFTIFPMLTLLSSCSDFLDIQPTGKVIAQTGEEYRELLTSVYYNFPDDRSLTTLRTDELLLDPATTVAEDLNTYFDIWRWNDITQDENTASFSWRRFYHSIYIANYIIEHQHIIFILANDAFILDAVHIVPNQREEVHTGSVCVQI